MTYRTIEDIKPLNLEDFKKAFKESTGRDFVEGGDNKCEVLWLSCNLEDLRYWKSVVNNPALARTVNLVVFDDATFSESLLDIGLFRQLAGPHPNNKCILQKSKDNPSFQRDWRLQMELRARNLGSQVLDQMITRQYEWVRAKVEAHLDIRENRLDKELFSQALKRNLLPNFIKGVLTNLPTERSVYPRPAQLYTPPSRSPSVRNWDNEYPPGPVPRTAVQPRNCWSWSSRDADGHLEEMEQGFPPVPNKCLHLPPICAPFRLLSIILEALRESSKHLSEFSIIPGSDFPEGLLSSASFLTGFPMIFFLPPFIDNFRQQVSDFEWLVENLTTLRLAIGCPIIRDGESCVQFFRLLSKARKLKTLQIHIEEWRCVDPRQVLDSIMSPSLEELDLDGVEFTGRAFLSFLGRHPNLKKLSMYGCMYNGLSWWDLLMEARVTHSVLRTEELYINQAIWRDVDGQYAWNDPLELPEMSRRTGIWMSLEK
ncbi:uncharacterized protein IWZ02DRAFT_491895 [Phyllosticta citriasiana]|uniref:uncharacterized protein n=1 Tax=Phyllosticta citriasiana TaxID=595635 RepID=UPI0030FD84EE